MQQDAPNWVVLAQLLRPQGRKGELLAELLTDFPERFGTHPHVFLASEGFAGTKAEARPVEIADFWLPLGKNQGRVVLHFDGVSSISDAELLAGLEVIIPGEDRLPLDEDSSYVSDLTGCTLYDGDVAIGVVEDVQFATTPDGTRRLEDAAPLFAVRTPADEEVLVPFVKAFTVRIDIAGRRIEMKLPEGLVEAQTSPIRQK